MQWLPQFILVEILNDYHNEHIEFTWSVFSAKGGKGNGKYNVMPKPSHIRQLALTFKNMEFRVMLAKWHIFSMPPPSSGEREIPLQSRVPTSPRDFTPVRFHRTQDAFPPPPKKKWHCWKSLLYQGFLQMSYQGQGLYPTQGHEVQMAFSSSITKTRNPMTCSFII